MASTYSQLKIELIGTGDQAGTWGNTTNTNLGTAIEEAITGSANVTFASSNVALALTDTNASQTARNLRLNLTGTISTTQYLFVPAIEKQYLVRNGLTNSVIVANGSNSGATGTTYTLPANSSGIVFNDGTNISDAVTYISSLSNVTINGGTANALTLTNVSVISGNVNNVTSNASTFSNVTINGGTANFTGTILVSGNSSSAADIRLYENTTNGNNYVALKAPASLASNVSFVLPGADGTVNQAVVTDGSGNLSFANVAAAGIATNFTALQTFSGSTSVLASKFVNALEAVTVSATAATGTINYDATTQSVLYYTSNAAANWTVNFRASSGTSLDTAMSTGESVTVAFLVTQGSTAYYNSAVQVDGSSVTPKWQGGAAPTTGNASSIDAYVYTIVKTGSATFTVFASQTQFA